LVERFFADTEPQPGRTSGRATAHASPLKGRSARWFSDQGQAQQFKVLRSSGLADYAPVFLIARSTAI
jgi:hypothetical protein